jgi:acyl-CoA dehydrogenase
LFRPFDVALWQTLTDAGLTRLTLPENAGGSGATLREAAVVLGRAAAHAAPVPLAETDLLASWLLHAADLEVPEGPLTVASGMLAVPGSRVTGVLDRVPWARHTSIVVALADRGGDTAVVALPTDALAIAEGANLAGEPRDDLVVDVAAETLGWAPPGVVDELRYRGALARSIALAAAASTAVDLTTRYTAERVQFGRSLSAFQVVQHAVAQCAAEAASAQSAVDTAVLAATKHGFADSRVRFAIAAAKTRSGTAGSSVARISHQLHGALGVTLEHHLRLTTTRIWSWREEFGNEDIWNAKLARLALKTGGNGLWPTLTRLP